MATAANSSSGAWTPEAELALFMAMVGLRPVGIHRHFRLVNIYMRVLGRIGGAGLSMSDLKHRLDQLYDIKLLDEIEAEDDDEGDSQRTDPEQPVARSNIRTGSHAVDDSGGDSNGPSLPGASLLGMAAHSAPATSNGGAIDVSDPEFWRKGSAEFSLPWAEFGTLMVERAGANVADEREDIEASVASASIASTPKEATREATPEPTPEPASSDGRASPVPKRRRGRSSTPVPRSRAKAPAATPAPAAPAAVTRSAAPSTRKRPKKH
ncbi:hypothetical protein GGI00_005730 [Coemansia sp. RSA 2681]|nr:hypothetical protein GGI00_005730 [Coemansia sp. RSA 2681]